MFLNSQSCISVFFTWHKVATKSVYEAEDRVTWKHKGLCDLQPKEHYLIFNVP